MSSNPYAKVISGPPVYNITINPNVMADDATLESYYQHLLWTFHYLFPEGNPVVNQARPANPAHITSWYCDRFETVFTGALAPDHPVRRAVEYFVPSYTRARGEFTYATLTARINYLRSWEQSVVPDPQQPAAAAAPGTSQSSTSATAQVQPATAPASTAAPSSPIPQPSRPVSGQFSLSQSSSRPASGSFSAASPKKQG
ncbi:hypothetical protein E8E13_010384 [Curvularia kusanoi]|uniref:Uncharacterized protein n=1 Tax=Curvularia kusanoi TaxID=90978 RepID=A0A9P4TIE3_CURKU|nr:hypothetical protein E8E13_010384 [Curvularia kusanoi]